MGVQTYDPFIEPTLDQLKERDVAFCQRLAMERPDIAIELGPTFLTKIGLTLRKKPAKKLADALGVDRYMNQAQALDQRIARLEFTHRSPSSPLKSTAILDEVAEETGCTLGALLGRSRVPKIARARHKAMWRIRYELGYSLGQIAKIFDNRDHTTALHGIQRWQEILDARS